MIGRCARLAAFLAVIAAPGAARAVASAELYKNQPYRYGRFEARIRYAAGDGVVSSFFLWKAGSEVSGAYWNELDFEKLGSDCRMQTNTLRNERCQRLVDRTLDGRDAFGRNGRLSRLRLSRGATAALAIVRCRRRPAEHVDGTAPRSHANLRRILISVQRESLLRQRVPTRP